MRSNFNSLLTSAHDREAYVGQVARAVKPGGHVIVATFGPEGPTRCSGLEIVRYDPDSLHEEFGPSFRRVDHRSELHQTPMGTTQQFTYCYCVVSPESISSPREGTQGDAELVDPHVT